MGSPDDEIAVLLQSSHASATPASLAGVMASVTRTSQDMFASHCPVPPYPGVRPLKFHHGSLARTSSMSSAGAGQNSWQHDHKADQQHQRWPAPTPVHGDEKWMLDAKGEVLDMHTKPSFEAVYDSFTPMMHPAPAPDATPAVLGVGLHRYHSAPSAFLQAVADDAFSQIPPPLDNSTMDSTFGECGLPPITEQTDMERMDSGNSVVEFEQFLSFDSDFSKRAAMSALGVAKSENGDTFANLFPPAKETVSVREKGIPIAEKVVPKQEIITIVEEQHSEDSNSGTSEDNSLVNGFNAAMYSQDDIFRTDSITSMPTFQGGKRQRGFAGEFDSSSGSELNSKSYRFGNNQSTGLIRHVSLPTSGEGLNMDSNPDNHYVQMRLRAKRGCATHPRSIAERVRRTRISERMKKLQDLVPNMEKTTNTATMLDETMDYVRSLQNKITELQESIVQLKAGAAQIKSS